MASGGMSVPSEETFGTEKLRLPSRQIGRRKPTFSALPMPNWAHGSFREKYPPRRAEDRKSDTFPCEPRTRIRQFLLSQGQRGNARTRRNSRGHQNAHHTGNASSLSKTIPMHVAESVSCMPCCHGDLRYRGSRRLEPAVAGEVTRSAAFARCTSVGISAGHRNTRGTAGQ